MDVILTLFYIVFSYCVVYPPTEFVSAGFTIPQFMDWYLGSESMNFIGYHMKRISICALGHALLPFGYSLALWCSGVRGEGMPLFIATTVLIPFLMLYKISCWWEFDKSNHPVVKALLPYVSPESDWQSLASNFNTEFKGVDKVTIQLSTTSKFIATQNWLIKVTQYDVNLVHQNDCELIATATDSHDFSPSGEDEVQYVNIEVIPSKEDVKKFTFRISTTSLRELHTRLERPVRVPDHISLQPSIIERFVNVFRQNVDVNPIYYVDQELEACIGCLQNTADVKLNKRCEEENVPPCQQCNCRVMWCCACMARWWATRARGGPATWLWARGTCPVCRAVFCLSDVCPARRRP